MYNYHKWNFSGGFPTHILLVTCDSKETLSLRLLSATLVISVRLRSVTPNSAFT